MEQSPEDVLESVKALVDAWCGKRRLLILRFILQGYPLSSPLTDGWAELLKSLENVRAFTRDELSEEEKQTVDQLIASTSRIVYRR
ncbi:MAG: hypothetical protein M3458_00425 [Acidobacteriota bacterium]|nr:hypothetical protein [Acidobacteriota bacterium]